MQRLGLNTFLVEVNHGVVCGGHVDHLKPLQESPSFGSTPMRFRWKIALPSWSLTILKWISRTHHHSNLNHPYQAKSKPTSLIWSASNLLIIMFNLNGKECSDLDYYLWWFYLA